MADSTESFAQSQLRSYVDRVLNVLGEIDVLGDDKKAIYKELADEGFDRSVVSQLVGHLRKKAKKPGKFAEQSQLFDLYLAAYEGRAEGGDDGEDETGTVVATHAAREQADEDGVIEHISPPASLTSNSQAERRPESTEQSAGANADEAVPSALSAPIQPATAAQTGSDVLSDRTPAEQVQVGPDPSLVEREAVESSAKDPGVDSLDVNEGGDHATSDGNAVASHRPLMQGGAVVARLAHNQEADGANPSPATNSLGSAADKSESGGVSPSASPAPTDPEALYAKAVELVLQEGRASPSMLQRRLVVGFNRASDLVERMEREGVVARSPAGFLDVVNHDGPTFQPEASVH